MKLRDLLRNIARYSPEVILKDRKGLIWTAKGLLGELEPWELDTDVEIDHSWDGITIKDVPDYGPIRRKTRFRQI